MYKALNAHSEKSNRRLRVNITEYVLKVYHLEWKCCSTSDEEPNTSISLLSLTDDLA